MNLPGVTVALTPRARSRPTPSTVRTTLRVVPNTKPTTVRRVLPKISSPGDIPLAEVGAVGERTNDNKVPATVRLPHVTPGIRRMTIDRRKRRKENPGLPNEPEWLASYAGYKIHDLRPYNIQTVVFNSCEVFVPPNINIETDKYFIVDSGERSGEPRYFMSRDAPKSVHKVEKEVTGISYNNEGGWVVTTFKPSAAPMSAPKTIVLPPCATPRHTTTVPHTEEIAVPQIKIPNILDWMAGYPTWDASDVVTPPHTPRYLTLEIQTAQVVG